MGAIKNGAAVKAVTREVRICRTFSTTSLIVAVVGALVGPFVGQTDAVVRVFLAVSSLAVLSSCYFLYKSVSQEEAKAKESAVISV